MRLIIALFALCVAAPAWAATTSILSMDYEVTVSGSVEKGRAGLDSSTAFGTGSLIITHEQDMTYADQGMIINSHTYHSCSGILIDACGLRGTYSDSTASLDPLLINWFGLSGVGLIDSSGGYYESDVFYVRIVDGSVGPLTQTFGYRVWTFDSVAINQVPLPSSALLLLTPLLLLRRFKRAL